MKKYRYVALSSLFGVLGRASSAFAQSVNVNIPRGSVVDFTTVSDLINNIATFMIFAGTVGAVIFLIWAGIAYVSAGADQQKVTQAKQMLKTGLIGSLIVFGVGTIIATIRLIGSGDLSQIFR
ncbi:MAG: hypothetical protein A3B99_02775 [Candidatus Yanofskybacteria bacterium RIFCSPHIGHO2_02_FULL_44_12b]|uniref:DUF4134 domain-containing protein n=2 Tax=Candidatus Yanofskyibacteriota TaxID=1752733 RepID=A0A1F8GLR3_9BACT|nr:MAG: hypothetical protein UW79_C0017G0007 [Candidatus Yanofskybacteria bacterium GW2011_GWA2_44_9]OGN05027.1 MAG: hypothetical protein A2659_02640 [Candidatus Yanofskybacteria bacterium RIFCSPHIGHO2_01_FULL_44_24]OGN16214.1 MAG: hypothetical protein A3B99_02775 [Candidatus Yanofskybacteria bacterium RIFCSPHIGHO2_02_FULL_44_12b]OGN26342.1 MAG: hypothetical protein A2925_00415 [Candidatus Yanofskybacteria bacterium RIFCSPLOWO2_01_FULL_44_22]